jgi:hypothetical protein
MDQNIAGIRFINSIENYNRALINDFEVKEPLKFGLFGGCCIVNKKVWEQSKFNEELVASEDKEWSERVMKRGYRILDLNETFFYFINRNQKASLKRYKIETIAEYQLTKKKFPSPVFFFGSFLKKVILTNTRNYFKTIANDFLVLKTKYEIYKKLKRD